MITAYVGGILNTNQDRGNGKTATMTFSLLFAKYPNACFLYDGEDISIELNEPVDVSVFTNYKCSFADKVLSPSDIVVLFESNELKNCLIGIDEMQVLWDSHFGMSKKGVKNKLQRLVQQSRKRSVSIYYTSQQFGNVHAVLRRHTNKVFECIKRHYDGNICYDDQCYLKHYVDVIDLDFRVPIWNYPMESIFEFYDSDEIIFQGDDI